MAITDDQSRQPYLDNLELPDFDLKVKRFPLPTHADIDPDEVEYFLDIDLDELSVFFGDRSVPYSIDEVGHNYSLMILDHSDEVIGVNIHRFLSEAIKVHPELVAVLRHVTVIAGECLETPGSIDPEIKQGLRARIRGWVSERVRLEERRDVFTQFAQLIGIH